MTERLRARGGAGSWLATAQALLRAPACPRRPADLAPASPRSHPSGRVASAIDEAEAVDFPLPTFGGSTAGARKKQPAPAGDMTTCWRGLCAPPLDASTGLPGTAWSGSYSGDRCMVAACREERKAGRHDAAVRGFRDQTASRDDLRPGAGPAPRFGGGHYIA